MTEIQGNTGVGTDSVQQQTDTAGSDLTEQTDDAGQNTFRHAEGAGNGSGGRLIEADRAQDYQHRWSELKGEFVDNPKRTLLDIDGLVGEVLNDLEETFRRQRGAIETDLRDDDASTEDLRVAFGRYREFFDRLLSL